MRYTNPRTLLFIARQHTDARYWYSKSVRLSVCPSVRPWRFGIIWKRLNISSQFFSPYGIPIILVLPASNIFTKFRRGHPLRGAKIQVGLKNLRFSTNTNDVSWVDVVKRLQTLNYRGQRLHALNTLHNCTETVAGTIAETVERFVVFSGFSVLT